MASVVPAQTYHVSQRWKIGGEGGWDYVTSDDSAHRLYLPHNSRVEVVDTTTGKTIGAITGMKRTHGVALPPDGSVGYISDGGSNAIVVFDRTNFSIKTTVPAGTGPDSIAYEPVSKTVWAFNGRSSNISILDTNTNRIVATVPLPGRPEFSQVDGRGSVFLNIEDKNQIMKFDGPTRSPIATWPLPGCESPSGLAIDRDKHRLFAVCENHKMAVVDDDNGKVLGLADIGEGPDAAGYDPKSRLAFSSNGADGTLTVIDTDKPSFPVLQNVKTKQGARTMAVDAATGRIYLVTADYGPAPESTQATPRPRRPVIPDTFEVLVVEK